MDEKDLTPKFLYKCRELALAEKDGAVPYAEPDLWVPKMWAKGVIAALYYFGYKVVKKDELKKKDGWCECILPDMPGDKCICKTREK